MPDQLPDSKPGESPWHRLIAWLTAPPLSVRLLQDELARAHAENRRLSGLLEQAWEQSRIIPVQANHQPPLSPPAEQNMSYGEILARDARMVEDNYQAWLADEEKRRLGLRAVMENANGTSATDSRSN